MTGSYGEVVLSRISDPTRWGRDRLRIDKASPRALISGELMRRIAADECEPWATVTSERPLVITLADDYGQRFIYRVHHDQYDPVADTFPMEWPD